jgi:hypothetical protein
MREVLIFGAMMMHLRESIVSTRGNVATGGADSKDSGIKAWLEKYAPKVPQSSAHRFESVALAARDLWDGLPETLAKKIEFPELVTAPEPKLAKIDKRLPGKRKELFKFAQGFSQRSLLDTYVENHGRGGNQYDRGGGKGKRRKLSQAAIEKLIREGWTTLGGSLQIQTKEKTFRYLNDAELDAILDTLSAAEAAIRLWRNTPKTERDATFRDALAAEAKRQTKK